jgi:hypothetical protein
MGKWMDNNTRIVFLSRNGQQNSNSARVVLNELAESCNYGTLKMASPGLVPPAFILLASSTALHS